MPSIKACNHHNLLRRSLPVRLSLIALDSNACKFKQSWRPVFHLASLHIRSGKHPSHESHYIFEFFKILVIHTVVGLAEICHMFSRSGETQFDEILPALNFASNPLLTVSIIWLIQASHLTTFVSTTQRHFRKDFSFGFRELSWVSALSNLLSYEYRSTGRLVRGKCSTYMRSTSFCWIGNLPDTNWWRLI